MRRLRLIAGLVLALPACADVLFADFETYERGAESCSESDCPTMTEADDDRCIDGDDNDGDGFVDCDDFDCIDAGACGDVEGSPNRCADGLDNDGDGQIDCEDTDCRDCAVDGWTAATCGSCP